jgi:hypothetical protein
MKKIIALAALAALSATASAANLFSDGSFESLSSGGSWTIDTGVLGDGWTVGLAPNTSAAGQSVGLEVRQSGVAGTAQAGSKFIELDGNQNDEITQTIATKNLQQYEISFYVADRPDVTSTFLSTSGGYGYKISSGPETISTTDIASFGTAWKLVTIDFTALASTTTFSIWGAGTSDSYGTSFDNFQAVAVPEPGTLGLFAAGLAMLGLSARRRSRR